MFTPAREVDCNRLIVAASLPTLKSLSVTNVFFTLKKNDIPKNLCLNFTIHVDFHSYSLIDSLNSIVDVCAVPSFIRHFDFRFPLFCWCTLFSFLANLNSSFESNSYLQLQWSPTFCIGPCDCKHLSHALRQDPAITRHSLRRSRSLDDLKSAPASKSTVELIRAYFKREVRRAPYSFCTTHRPLSVHHHSCPDLLELQSLHKLHPRIVKVC